MSKISRPLFKPLEGGRFRFRCHPGMSCFTTCCARLQLILTPYDILRIKNRLGLSSEQFLERYTRTNIQQHSRFPMITLNMEPPEDRCPFLSKTGCTIYEDRPAACRLYPIGRAATKAPERDRPLEHFFIVDEPHCRGFGEDREWEVEEWLSDQGVDEYDAMNAPWLEIITAPHPPLGDTEERKIQMFSMASYNLDRFRAFLFESSFFTRFEVETALRERLRHDDVELMRFGFEWLKFSLFGESSSVLAPRASSSAR